MNKHTALLLLAFLISACGAPTEITPPPAPATEQLPSSNNVPVATFTPVCVSSQPTQEDIDSALDYTGDVFEASDWEQTYETADDRVSVIWQNVPDVAVVFLQAIIFPCGYEEPDLNKYFNDENWALIFENYESYTINLECRTDDGLRLYEIDAFSDAINYKVKYWVENDTNNRIITTMITYPLGSETKLDAYASLLFPELPNCS